VNSLLNARCRPERKANAELRIRNVAKVCGWPQRPSPVPRPLRARPINSINAGLTHTGRALSPRQPPRWATGGTQLFSVKLEAL